MLLFATVFVTGAAIMIVEILGTRILAPFYGNTLYTWVSMISTALVFLSLGYFLGGIMGDRDPRPEPFYLILLVSGMTLLLIPLFANFVLINTNFLGIRIGVLASSILLFSLPFALLGSIAPYAIRLRTHDIDAAGKTAGSLYGIATLGSFAGTVLVGFYLIPALGIKSILYLTATPLIALGLTWFLFYKKYKVALIIPFLIAIYAIDLSLAMPNHELLYKSDSVYGQVKVVEKRDLRYLLIDGSIHSCSKNKIPCSSYIYVMAIAPLLLDEPPEDALMLGLGGGILSMSLIDAGISTDSVEINPTVVDAAREFFNFTGEVVISDARRFVKSTKKRYDLIFLDAYSDNIPSHLPTLEAFREIKKPLKEHGIFVVNTLGWIQGDGSIIQSSIYKTLNQVYPNVYVLPIELEGYTNVVFFASERSLNLSSHVLPLEGIVLTDDYNPLEFWAVRGAEEARRDALDYFGADLLLS